MEEYVNQIQIDEKTINKHFIGMKKGEKRSFNIMKFEKGKQLQIQYEIELFKIIKKSKNKCQ